MIARRLQHGLLVLSLVAAVAVGYAQAQGPAPGHGAHGGDEDGGFVLDNLSVGVPQAEHSPEGQQEGPANLTASASGDGVVVQDRPTGLLNYQGRLLQNGSPVNGTIDISFTLNTAETGGSPWWQETQMVEVNGGLFNVSLGAVNPLTARAVSFQNQQWLGVQPEGAASELVPRQPLGAVAAAMNLMPGATMVDENSGGGYSYSLWVRAVNRPAVYASSSAGTGVTAGTGADNAPGSYGSASGSGNGSHGVEASMSGGSDSCPFGTTECGSGLYATASGDAYGAYVYGANRSSYIGIQGDNGYYGLYVYSLIAPDGNGIWTNGASSFNDYVTFSAGKSGYVVDIALNDGSETLEKGDVVVISGYDAPVLGRVPVVRVRKAAAANATGVIGVVDVLYVPCETVGPLEAGQACGGFEGDETTIRPGEYLGVVTLGAYEAVKVDATAGPIRPGDVLASSGQAGQAMRAMPLEVQGVSFHAPGTIVGKALGSLERGTGVIPIFVSSR